MSADVQTLTWSTQLRLSKHDASLGYQLPGDKIILPPSALEQLLAAAPLVSTEPSVSGPLTSTFDPFNPHTFQAEREARNLFIDQQRQLPHPLTFRLVNPSNGRIVYAGIREFSADEGEVILSQFLVRALGLESATERSEVNGATESVIADAEKPATNGTPVLPPLITIHARQLPRGKFVKLRPLEAGYDADDWKALLERYLRDEYTTLTNGEVLTIPKSRAAGQEFRLLIDGFDPEGDGICIVDTDLEVDIEALNEEQARETLERLVAKRQRAPGTTERTSVGGKLDLFNAREGQVLDNDYVDYEIPSWDRSQGLDIELSGEDDDGELDLLASPLAPRQRARPRVDEHVFGDFSTRYPKRIRLQPTNVEMEDAEAIWVAVRGPVPIKDGNSDATSKTRHFTVRATTFDPQAAVPVTAQAADPQDAAPNPDDVRCGNCYQWIPQRTFVLHENFCLRNNILCPRGCNRVFQKRSEAWQNHWHCPHDEAYGDTQESNAKHDDISHTTQICPSCSRSFPSLPRLAQHRTTVCPGKLILCQFCHLIVPQEGNPDEPNPEALLSGLTPHELSDGARTTECHLCNKFVRLRDMTTHLKHHEFEKLSRPPPRICRNINCGRTLDGVNKSGDTRAGTRTGQGPGNEIGLCSACFGPLYVSAYDPDGKAMKRRVERRYLTQLLTGCGKAWCRNEFCKTGRKNAGQEQPLSTKDALPLIKPFLDGLSNGSTPLHFCVDEASQRRRQAAELLAAERFSGPKTAGYALEWCVAALEAEGGDLDKARDWLKNWALQRRD